jgi:hypothetical protein
MTVYQPALRKQGLDRVRANADMDPRGTLPQDPDFREGEWLGHVRVQCTSEGVPHIGYGSARASRVSQIASAFRMYAPNLPVVYLVSSAETRFMPSR